MSLLKLQLLSVPPYHKFLCPLTGIAEARNSMARTSTRKDFIHSRPWHKPYLCVSSSISKAHDQRTKSTRLVYHLSPCYCVLTLLIFQPEWYFNHIQNVSHEHKAFMTTIVQDLLDRTDFRSFSAWVRIPPLFVTIETNIVTERIHLPFTSHPYTQDKKVCTTDTGASIAPCPHHLRSSSVRRRRH